MKRIVRLTESDLARIVRRVINEENKNFYQNLLKEDEISQARKNFFNKLATEISTKLIGKKILYGKIGDIDHSSVIIKSYNGRNHDNDFKNEPIERFNLSFKVKRDKGDWTGLLMVSATYNNGVISLSPSVKLYSGTGGDNYDFGSPITPTTPMLWVTFGGKELWSKAPKAKNL
jgi:hypothetical protein